MSRSDHEVRPTGGRGPLRTDGRLHVWRRLDLIHDGRTFLRRRGVDLRLGGVLVHRIDAPDPGLDLHDHPWPFVSIVLRGGYTEEFAETRHASRQADLAEANDRPEHGYRCSRGVSRRWGRWSIHRMPLDIAHRITDADKGTVTLVIRGRKRRRWGFYLPHGWTDWANYDYETRRPSAARSNKANENHDQGVRLGGES